MSVVIAFPALSTCPTCHRPCAESELSGCVHCDVKYCRFDKWTCKCDSETWPTKAKRFLASLLTRMLAFTDTSDTVSHENQGK